LGDILRSFRQLAPLAQVWLIVAIAALLQCSLNGLAYFELFPDMAGRSLNGVAKNSAYLINGSLALLACWYFDGRQGLRRIIHPYGRVLLHPGWWLLAIGIMVPVLFAALYLNDWLLGQPIRLYSLQLPSWDSALEDVPMFVKVAVSDELFWIGFVYPRLLHAGFSPLKAALVMGVFWGMEYVPFIFTGFFVAPGISAESLVLGWFAITPLYVWIYHKTGSALLLVVFNVSMQFAYSAVPVLPRVTGDNNVLAMANLLTLLCGLLLWWLWPKGRGARRPLPGQLLPGPVGSAGP
jgi:hypothetical protein